MSNNQNNHLRELGESKYEIIAGESDIRGWTVKNDFGRILGKVNDLVLDTDAQKVKYFILDTEGNELYLIGRRILLPLEYAELDEVYRNVIFPGLMANELSSLPTYERSALNERTEDIVQTTFRNFRHDRDGKSGGSNLVDSHLEASHSTPAAAKAQLSSSLPRTNNDYETHYTDQYMDDAVRHQSVAGVFENRDHADVAIARLIENGFHRRDIHISFRDEAEIVRGNMHENESITGFFSHFFNAEESKWLNSEDGRKFPVVIVNRLSIAEAERAAEILDRFGALNIDENLKLYQSKTQMLTEKPYHSRIVGH